MSMQPDAHLSLASGRFVRVTSYLVEVVDPTGDTDTVTFDMQTIAGVRRDGNDVRIMQSGLGGISLFEMASLDDAGQLEAQVRAAITGSGRQVVPVPFQVATSGSPSPSTSKPLTTWQKVAIGSIAGFFAIIFVVSFFAEDDKDDNGRSVNPDKRPLVTYSVTSSSRSTVSLTYQNSGGNTEQLAAKSTPWEVSFRMGKGEFLYLSAQNGQANTTIRCGISVDGREIEWASSEGPFQIASCSGSVPR